VNKEREMQPWQVLARGYRVYRVGGCASSSAARAELSCGPQRPKGPATTSEATDKPTSTFQAVHRVHTYISMVMIYGTGHWRRARQPPPPPPAARRCLLLAFGHRAHCTRSVVSLSADMHAHTSPATHSAPRAPAGLPAGAAGGSQSTSCPEPLRLAGGPASAFIMMGCSLAASRP
jgi:hypothetical protein